MNKPLAYLAAAAAFVAPPLLLVSDILLVMVIPEPALMTQRIGLSVFVIAIAGVAVYARGRAPWQIGGGAALAILGALAIVIRPSFLAAPVRPPAVLLPLGLLVMSAAMIGSNPSRQVAACIGAGALLFPLARQSGVPAALIGGDAIFLIAFWSLGRRMTNPKPQIPNPGSQAN